MTHAERRQLEDDMAIWGTTLWMGKSRRVYSYEIYPLDVDIGTGPANYIYAKRGLGGRWVPIYIGQTNEIADHALANHHRRDCIIRQGATNIHINANIVDRARVLEASDLRRAYVLPCTRKSTPT